MSREDSQMKIRLPEKLRGRVVEAAIENKRTLNAEILARLDLSFMHEIEGRAGDVRSLANEVMELRHAFVSVIMAVADKDKTGFAELVDNLLAKHQIPPRSQS